MTEKYCRLSKIICAIQLQNCPSYAPNLDLIERYWKFFKTKPWLSNLCFVHNCLRSLYEYGKPLSNETMYTLTVNFQIIGNN
jgi:hypothetical protein